MKRFIVRTLAVVLLPILLLFAKALLTRLPAALTVRTRSVSLRVEDRSGKTIREIRTEDGALAAPVRLSDLSPSVVPALLAAEDARFFEHRGVDPVAVFRAALQFVKERHVVSGASTITQQLARTVVPRPRTLFGKFSEMALALRIEASLTKARILEEYLSRIEFGPNLRGVDAASRAYFDKPPSELDLAEAAALVAIPRGPSLYDPRRSVERVTKRRNRILERLRERKVFDARAIDAALAEPVKLQPGFAEGGAEHLALGLSRGVIPSSLPSTEAYRRVETTIDGALEHEVETLARRAEVSAHAFDLSALAVVVIDNASGEVLAYVGSPNYFDREIEGANDGVLALRQPGSALKPFVYAAAMEHAGMTAATLLPDVELTLETPAGPFTPKNYDGKMHGPVTLREALASSLNVPAVYTASVVGPARVLEMLHRTGFASLTADATRYGAAIALGDGEVRLLELAQAYATLARGGVKLKTRLIRAAWTADGRAITPPAEDPIRVVDGRTAAILTDVLSDDSARSPSFGRGGALELPFPVAAKTGTSKGYRDNWTVGFTHEVTVAVWAGNFDGHPMTGSTGVTGAGPLFHDVMLAAMEHREPGKLVDRSGLVEVQVCAESGELPGASCTHRVSELFRPEDVPIRSCALHVRARVDPENGLLAGPGCSYGEERTFESYRPRFLAWARSARRPTLPVTWSPRCPGARGQDTTSQVARVKFPSDGARFVMDAAARVPEIVLAAAPGENPGELGFIMDGRRIGAARAPFELPWRLEPGRHRLQIATRAGALGDAVTFEVADARMNER